MFYTMFYLCTVPTAASALSASQFAPLAGWRRAALQAPRLFPPSLLPSAKPAKSVGRRAQAVDATPPSEPRATAWSGLGTDFRRDVLVGAAVFISLLGMARGDANSGPGSV
jgi:hypothetical protein